MRPSAPPLGTTLVGGLLGFLVGLGPACYTGSPIGCWSDRDCVEFGPGGACEFNSFCSFPDVACPSGRRWHERAITRAGLCLTFDEAERGNATTTSVAVDATSDPPWTPASTSFGEDPSDSVSTGASPSVETTTGTIEGASSTTAVFGSTATSTTTTPGTGSETSGGPRGTSSGTTGASTGDGETGLLSSSSTGSSTG